MSWRHLENVLTGIVYLDDAFWKGLEDIFARCLEDVLKTFLQDILKTFRRCLEDVLKTYDQDDYIGLDQDALKTFSEHEDERRLQGILKMSLSSSRRMFAGEGFEKI